MSALKLASVVDSTSTQLIRLYSGITYFYDAAVEKITFMQNRFLSLNEAGLPDFSWCNIPKREKYPQ
jgi:hypothetical protein